jgi:hypothetical protein
MAAMVIYFLMWRKATALSVADTKVIRGHSITRIYGGDKAPIEEQQTVG